MTWILECTREPDSVTVYPDEAPRSLWLFLVWYGLGNKSGY